MSEVKRIPTKEINKHFPDTNNRQCFEICRKKKNKPACEAECGEYFTITAGLQKLIERILPDISSEPVKLSPQWPFPTEDYTKIKGIVFRIRLAEKSGRFEMIDSQTK